MSYNLLIIRQKIITTNYTTNQRRQYKMNTKAIQQKQQKMLNKKAIESDATRTPTKYKTAFNNFNQYIKQNKITTINDDNINDIILQYLKHLKESNLTKNTIKQYMILINNFLRNECKLNIEYIKLPKPEKTKPKYINIQQYQEIQQHLETRQQEAKTKHQIKTIETDKQIIQLIFNTGLRIHEVLKITIAEIKDAEKDKNNIYQLEVIGKGSKQRTIFISSTVYDSLMQYIRKYSTPTSTYIFESNKKPGTPTTTRTIERHFNTIAKELDAIHGTKATDKNSYQELLKPHNLRHTFAVVKLEKGMSINAMQELLGHSSITTTQIYTRLNNDSLSDAMAKTIL